jgi:hypothetical protein
MLRHTILRGRVLAKIVFPHKADSPENLGTKSSLVNYSVKVCCKVRQQTSEA